MTISHSRYTAVATEMIQSSVVVALTPDYFSSSSSLMSRVVDITKRSNAKLALSFEQFSTFNLNLAVKTSVLDLCPPYRLV